MWPGSTPGAPPTRPAAPQPALLALGGPGLLTGPSFPVSSAPPLVSPRPASPQPSQWAPWAGGWDQASLAGSFSMTTLTPPVSPADWIADFGASFHTTPDAGILTSSRPPPSSCPSSIIVGDGSALPVTSVGDSIFPGSFRLNNVLIAPHIVQNLLFVRQFTVDNSCSMEFDPFGLSVRDLTTRRLLARCDNSGPLYTLCLLAASTSPSSPLPHALATTVPSVTWHRRLGHPGADVLSKLSSSSAISCTRGTRVPLSCLSVRSSCSSSFYYFFPGCTPLCSHSL